MFQCWIDCGSANVVKHSSSIGTDRMRGLSMNGITWNDYVLTFQSAYFVDYGSVDQLRMTYLPFCKNVTICGPLPIKWWTKQQIT